MTLTSLPSNDLLFARAGDLRAKGIEPYSQGFLRSRPLYQVNEDYEAAGSEYDGEKVALNLCGRVMSIVDDGDTLLVRIEDQDAFIQLVIDPANLDATQVSNFDYVYVGDYIGVEVDYISRIRRRLTAHVRDWKFLALSLLPIPSLSENPERQRRQRYLHLAGSLNARERFVARSKVLRYLRNCLTDEDFLEVNTPVLQPGADGKSMGFRNAPETYLKSLLVGSLEKVYEITQHFNGSEIDWQHYPESQVMRCSMTPADVNDAMRLTEQLIADISQSLHSTVSIPWKPRDQMIAAARNAENANEEGAALIPAEPDSELEIDLSLAWSRRPVKGLVHELTGINFTTIDQVEAAVEAARLAGMTTEGMTFASVSDVLMEVVRQLVGPALVQPTFITGLPQMVDGQNNPSVRGESFHLYINGMKFAEGFSGVNDPSEQEAYVLEQEQSEDDYQNAIKLGIPPFSSVTLDIDRLVMLMTGATDIRDVIYFPTL